METFDFFVGFEEVCVKMFLCFLEAVVLKKASLHLIMVRMLASLYSLPI